MPPVRLTLVAAVVRRPDKRKTDGRSVSILEGTMATGKEFSPAGLPVSASAKRTVTKATGISDSQSDRVATAAASLFDHLEAD